MFFKKSEAIMLADDDPLPLTDDEFAELAEDVSTWTPIDLTDDF